MSKENIAAPSVLEGQLCPMCNKKTLKLIEAEHDIAFFGKCFLFSMSCTNCHYHKADIEASDTHAPAKYTLEINCEDDLKIRIVKSAQATIKIPHMVTVEGGDNTNGFITNVEGVLQKIKKIIEFARDNEVDSSLQKKAKSQLKKLGKVLWGQDSLKLVIEDPTGNSAIVSEKAVKSKL